MLGFSKKKKQLNNEPVDANEFMESDEVSKSSEEEIETELSIPSGWNVPNEERYVYAFHNSQSPKLKINQISIYGMELIKKDKNFIVTGLIKNTVPKEIQFGPTTILLLDSEKQLVARKDFDLSKLETIPQNGARPWKFVFSNDDVVNDKEIPSNDWSLAFELKKKHQLDLEESWEKSIADDTKSGLEKMVANATPLKPGEVNFMGVNAKHNENADLVVTILIRNGSAKNITLQQLPLGLKDGSDEEIVRGNFKLENFKVKANTSKPWTFIFPASTITKEDIDLSRWKVYPIK